MTTKSKSKKASSQEAVQDNPVDRRREWRLDLPLSTIVEGDLPEGKKFKEKTKLENISSTGAYFCLDSGITVGSKLNLVIELPSQISEGKKIKLRLGGLTVRLEETTEGAKKQGVALMFDEEFQFVEENKKNK